MCGICGIAAPTPSSELLSALRRMNQALRHRGPDDTGEFIDGACGIAMTRLAIIDVLGGQQPISNEDGRFSVVLNGEIYNYPELTIQLRERGHRFSTSSDTEALVHLYEDVGKECPSSLSDLTHRHF